MICWSREWITILDINFSMLITNGLGAALSAIAMVIGGWNKVHDDAANRQLEALANLSNSVKARFQLNRVVYYKK